MERGLLTVLSGGALGATLTGVFKRRDEMTGSRQLRSFSPILIALPIVGAASTAIVFAIFDTGLVTFGKLSADSAKWSHHAVLGFLAGFSEMFFLGVVARLVASSSKEENGATLAGRDASERTASGRDASDGPLGRSP